MLGFDDFVIGSCNQLACAAAKQIASTNGLSVSPLFIYGACGVGKTHLLQAICKHAKHNLAGGDYVCQLSDSITFVIMGTEWFAIVILRCQFIQMIRDLLKGPQFTHFRIADLG